MEKLSNEARLVIDEYLTNITADIFIKSATATEQETKVYCEVIKFIKKIEKDI